VPPEAASAIASSEPNSNELIERRELGAQVRAPVAAFPRASATSRRSSTWVTTHRPRSRASSASRSRP
jgi:hypothetical protein